MDMKKEDILSTLKHEMSVQENAGWIIKEFNLKLLEALTES